MNRSYFCKNDYFASKNSCLDTLNIYDLIPSSYKLKDCYIHTGGWQSWNPGFEIDKNKKQPSTSSIIKGWNQYLIFPGSTFKPSKNIVLTQFITYLRWNDFYLIFASTGNVNNDLPPVQFIINKKQKTVQIEIADKNHKWSQNDLQAEISVITADSYFELRNEIKKLYNANQFEQLAELGTKPSGWESWYNHYTDINQQLIYKDLEALSNTKNIISEGNFSSKVFQIDDGWEKQLGNWEWDTSRFTDSPSQITSKIENQGFIPGLWIAPFIVDSRSPVAMENPDWLLKDKKGKLVKAGYNPKWGEKGYFYAFDLSNDNVLEWIDNNIEKAINTWGFRYLKFDFLYAGMIDGQHSNNGASFYWYNRAIKKITSRKNNQYEKKVFYLGCGVPFEQSFKYLPLSRIGCDTYEHWENKLMKFINWNGRKSAYLNVKDTIGHSYWNNTIFSNDPDVIFIRDSNCTLSNEQKLLIAAVNIIFGNQFMYSDDPNDCNSDNEIALNNQIIDLQKKYCNEEFGVTYTGNDTYSVFSKSGNYSFLINLKNGTMED